MLSLCLLVLFSLEITAKDLHIKNSQTSALIDENEDFFDDLSYYSDFIHNDKERYARHVELVTESVLEHLLKEIKKKYPVSQNATGNIPKLMKRLQMKLRRTNKKKHKKYKKKSLHANNNTSLTNGYNTTNLIE